MRSDEEINEVLNEISQIKDDVGTKFPSMSYEEGVEAALLWMKGETEENPMEEL